MTPMGDGTGPFGQGPQGGKGLGPCGGGQRRGWGGGRGQGGHQGGAGRGQGRGQGADVSQEAGPAKAPGSTNSTNEEKPKS